MKLSKHRIDNLQSRDRPYEVLDHTRPGLVLTVYPSGTKSFSVRYFVDGKQWRFHLGKYSDTFSIDKARTLATKTMQGVTGGDDHPQVHRIAERTKRALGLDKAERVQWCWDTYVRRYVEKKLKPSSARSVKHIGKFHILPKLGKKNLADVSARECKALISKIAEKSPVAANRVRAVLSAFLNYCIDELWIANNVVAGLKPPTEEKHRKRRRILTEREIKWLWQACNSVGYPWGQMLQLSILTGARRGEVAAIEWDELDYDSAWWHLPGTKTKNHRDHEIYISDLFRAVLKTIPKHRGKFVFSDHKKPPSGFSKGFARVTAKMDELAKAEFEEVPPWTPHDLRRTFASYVAKLPDVDIATISLLLNHWEQIGQLKEIYIQWDVQAKTQAAFKAWADRIAAIVE